MAHSHSHELTPLQKLARAIAEAFALLFSKLFGFAAGATRLSWAALEKVVELPFRALGVGPEPQSAADQVAGQRNTLNTSSAALERQIADKLASKQTPAPEAARTPPDLRPPIDFAERDRQRKAAREALAGTASPFRAAAICQAYANAALSGRLPPDIVELDVTMQAWILQIGTDEDQCRELAGLSHAALEKHIMGVAPLPRLPAWPSDEFVAEFCDAIKQSKRQRAAWAAEREAETVVSYG